jgi:YidC/Oxa1 family membrane protein insertase
MRQETRLVLAMVISSALFIGYYMIFPPKLPMQPVMPAVIDVATAIPATPAAPALPTETVAEAKNLLIETPVSLITLSTRGGLITSAKLKDYHESVQEGAPPQDLLTRTENSYAFFLGLTGYDRLTPETVFELKNDTTAPDGSRTIELMWQDSTLRITKSLVFNSPKGPYAISVGYSVENLTDKPLQLAPYLESGLRQKVKTNSGGMLGAFQAQDDLYLMQALAKNSLEHPSVDNLQTQTWQMAVNQRQLSGLKSVEAAANWAALTDRYFLVGSIGDQALNAHAWFGQYQDFLISQLKNPLIQLAPHNRQDGYFVGYAGPKVLEQLKTAGGKLERSIDYGWFSLLAMPILWLMTTLHKLIPNFGLVIITLTFIIKLALHPVNKKSMTSMKAMQQLQPKLEHIRAKYGDNKEKMNVEVMQLFKTHKVNPAAGCLPMLMQMPVFIVLYKVLWNAIELYHAPFFGPYKDLSAPDPYFVLPVLLGIFFFLQQKLTPNPSADPTQKKMMMFMPLIFSGTMLFMPVGLVVYIFVNTLMSVAQQFMMTRDLTYKDVFTGQWAKKTV